MPRFFWDSSKPVRRSRDNRSPFPDIRGDRSTDQASSAADPHLCPHRERGATHERTTGHSGIIEPTRHQPHHRGRRGRRHHTSQTTLVVVGGMGQSQTTASGQHPVGSQLDTDRHTMAAPSQPHRENPTTTTRHQTLHSTRDPAERRPVPLSHHAGARRTWQTSCPTLQRKT